MLDSIISFSLHNGLLVLAIAALLLCVGQVLAQETATPLEFRYDGRMVEEVAAQRSFE